MKKKKGENKEVLKINRNFSLAFTWDPIMPRPKEEKNALTIIEAYGQSLHCLLKSIIETLLLRGGQDQEREDEWNIP